MAPLENGGFGGDRPTRVRPIDSLMRALLYMVQQIGRPASEADVRRLAPLVDDILDEQGFLAAGGRLGLEANALELGIVRLDDLPTPFAVTGIGQPAHVVVSGNRAQWMVLDVVEGHVQRMTEAEVRALGSRALVLREPPAPHLGGKWYAPLWARARPAIAKLAAASFLVNVLGLATPLFMMLVLNRVIGHGTADGIASLMTALCIGMLAAYTIDFALRVARGWLSARTGARLDVLMSAEVVHHLVQLPYRHFERTPSGVIAERLRQLDVLRAFFTGQMPVLAIDLAFVVLFLGATFAINLTLGLVTALAIPVLVGVSLATHRPQRRLSEETFEALAAKSSTVTETVANAATIKALGLEAEVEKRWQSRVEQAAWVNFRASHLANIAASASGVLTLVASLAIVVIGTHEIVEHRLSIGALIAANMLAMRALQPMRQLVAAWHQLQAVAAAFKRIDGLMREEVESQPGALAPMPPLAGDVTFERLLHPEKEPQNWLTYSGSMASQRHSALIAPALGQRSDVVGVVAAGGLVGPERGDVDAGEQLVGWGVPKRRVMLKHAQPAGGHEAAGRRPVDLPHLPFEGGPEQIEIGGREPRITGEVWIHESVALVEAVGDGVLAAHRPGDGAEPDFCCLVNFVDLIRRFLFGRDVFAY